MERNSQNFMIKIAKFTKNEVKFAKLRKCKAK